MNNNNNKCHTFKQNVKTEAPKVQKCYSESPRASTSLTLSAAVSHHQLQGNFSHFSLQTLAGHFIQPDSKPLSTVKRSALGAGGAKGEQGPEVPRISSWELWADIFTMARSFEPSNKRSPSPMCSFLRFKRVSQIPRRAWPPSDPHHNDSCSTPGF